MTLGKTELLEPDDTGIQRAALLLGDGALVAFPTETVYGLGADARDGNAVAGIFEAKGRPKFNPLIVHVKNRETAEVFGQIPKEAETFLAGGWPAGLTLVVPLNEEAGLSSLVTAGLPTVALRVPASPIAQRLLQAFDGPIAAPSANPSGRISPTRAEHVIQGLNGRISAVIDGGPTEAGLESTILAFSANEPVVLREGAFDAGDELPRQTDIGEDAPSAPGQLLSHYAPKASVRLGVTKPENDEWMIGFGDVAGDVSLSEAGDLKEAAARLFSLLHEADRLGVQKLVVAPIPSTGLGRAINDRLSRAAAPRN